MAAFQASLDDFFNFRAGAVLEDTHEVDERRAFEKHVKRFRSIQIEGDIYSVSLNCGEDCEGRYHREEWKKNERLHRDGKLPATTTIRHHYIPAETEWDIAVRGFYENGEFICEKDTTYEEIISKKPRGVQRHFGYEVP